MGRLLTRLALILLCTSLYAEERNSQPESPDLHWAFSSFLGTGWYQIDDFRSAFILRIPPRQTVRESWFNSRQDRGIGIEIKYTTTLGLLSFDELPNTKDVLNVGAFSFTPGVELEIPVTRNFYLRPFAHFGWGKEFEFDTESWIWFGGIKSRYRFPGSSNNLAIIGNIYYAGHNPSEGENGDLGGVGLGMEGSIPLGSWSYGETTLDLDWHVMYTHLGNAPIFSNPSNTSTTLEEMMEFGLALSPRDGNWNLWLWKPERLGLGVKWDPGSDFLAFTINFTSWFRR